MDDRALLKKIRDIADGRRHYDGIDDYTCYDALGDIRQLVDDYLFHFGEEEDADEDRMGNLTDLEARIHAFRTKIPDFIKGGRASGLRGLGEEMGELAEAGINGDDEEFYKEAADVVFVVMGVLAAEGVSLNDYLLKKLDRAEANIPKIIEKQRARRRGEA